MIPGFAASIIAAQLKADASDGASNSGQVAVESSQTVSIESNKQARAILDKFQELLVCLRHGTEAVIYPKSFCDCFRFPDGSHILPDVQQDALEFFHILCDHLDNALKGGPDERLLSRFFGGRSATQLICKGCPHRYERFEHFFTLQLTVFGNRSNSLLGSLQEFVAGELLEGDNQYFCSQCNKKVDTVKRTVLAELPDTIILGLKRFDFNYDTMQRIKLNVEVPFEHDLDMYPFCRENFGETPENSEPINQREPGYYQYSLAGIVVHAGMADSGHYFSVIRDPERLDVWLRFNDDVVTPIQNFNVDQFFGGQSHGKFAHVNAYILVYNRKAPVFIHPLEQIAAIENSVELVQHAQKLSMHSLFVDSVRKRHIWQCLNHVIKQAFSSSDEHHKENLYLDLVMKLCTNLQSDSINGVQQFLQPLEVSLQNLRKCSSILEHLLSEFQDEDAIRAHFFKPVCDVEPKQRPILPPFWTQLMNCVVNFFCSSNISQFSPIELEMFRKLISIICVFYGNLAYSLFMLLSCGSDAEPAVVQIAVAVQMALHEALQIGLDRIFSLQFFLNPHLSDESELLSLTRTLISCAHVAHLSENNPKLRSKRRAHLRKFVTETRHYACWNCLKLLQSILFEQRIATPQLAFDGLFETLRSCLQALLGTDFLIKYLYTPVAAVDIQQEIPRMFYSVVLRIMPMVNPSCLYVMNFSINIFLSSDFFRSGIDA
jgi:ubiquitin C-terminal hydrolase